MALSVALGSALVPQPQQAEALTISRTIWEDSITRFSIFYRSTDVTPQPGALNLFPQYVYSDAEFEQHRLALQHRCTADLAARGFGLGGLFVKNSTHTVYPNYTLDRVTYYCYGQGDAFRVLLASDSPGRVLIRWPGSP